MSAIHPENLDLWRRHGIVLGEKELQFELPSLEWGLSWSCYLHMEISCIRLIRDCHNARHRFLQQSLGLLDDPPWKVGHLPSLPRCCQPDKPSTNAQNLFSAIVQPLVE